eukprot:1147887-Pelagomonas_calceolata.AAC.1
MFEQLDLEIVWTDRRGPAHEEAYVAYVPKGMNVWVCAMKQSICYTTGISSCALHQPPCDWQFLETPAYLGSCPHQRKCIRWPNSPAPKFRRLSTPFKKTEQNIFTYCTGPLFNQKVQRVTRGWPTARVSGRSAASKTFSTSIEIETNSDKNSKKSIQALIEESIDLRITYNVKAHQEESKFNIWKLDKRM